MMYIEILPSKSLHLILELGGASMYLPPLCVTTEMLLRDPVTLLLSARPFSSVGVGPRLLELFRRTEI